MRCGLQSIDWTPLEDNKSYCFDKGSDRQIFSFTEGVTCESGPTAYRDGDVAWVKVFVFRNATDRRRNFWSSSTLSYN